MNRNLNPKEFNWSLERFNNTICYICLEDFKNEEGVCQMLCNDNHIFHKACIMGWYNTHDTCPICRSNVGIK
jgi:hypothetical protein